MQFELSFPRAARPYLIALQAGGPPPFDPEPKGLRPDDPAAVPAKPGGAPVPLRVDVDGMSLRVAPFPVREGRFGQIAGAAGSKVLWTVLPITGAHGRGGHKESPGRLEVFDFATLRAETLMEKADRFELAADATTLVVREGKRLRAIAASRSPEHDRRDPAASADTPSRKSGWIDLTRIRVSVDPRREWRQMLREVWRLQRDQFWVADMSGVDWDAVLRTYEPLLARVATRSELSDLIWEMQGELGTSHAYESGGDHRRPPPIGLGHLAAELHLADGGASYEIARIVSGDAWDPDADSPLNAVGVEAKVGERIVAVNGQPVSRERPPQALLVNQAGAKVELRLAHGSEDSASARTVLVTTLTDEVPARYREWVERNRAWVHEQSGGRVGYLHLPDMQSAGFAEFHRYFSAECDRDGLIVDVRYNRGGHVSQLLLEKVARKRIGYSLTRWGRPSPYPDEAVAGPVVTLTNEHAGSDGDIFSHNFKQMRIGPLVGTRTWGGVVGIWPRHALVDGTETTQPEFSHWFNDVGWGIENYGTDPDIEVDNAPQDATAARDRQLETAVATALEWIETDRHEQAGVRSTAEARARPAAASPLTARRGAPIRADPRAISAADRRTARTAPSARMQRRRAGRRAAIEWNLASGAGVRDRLSPGQPEVPPQQPAGDRDVQQVPQDAVDERRRVGAGRVEDRAGHPAAERHAEQRGHQHRADARAGLGRREVFADDDRVGRHDAALEQAEQRRDHVQRDEAVERQEQQQRDALQAGAEQQRAQSADAVRDDAERKAADDAAGKHQRQHLRAARRAIARDRRSRRPGAPAASTSRRSRRGRRRSAGSAARPEKSRDRCAAPLVACRGRRRRLRGRRPPPQDERRAAAWSRRRRSRCRNTCARQPSAATKCWTTGDQSAPGDIVAAGEDAHRDAAPAVEPHRGVGQQRPERRRAADADQQALGKRVLPERRRRRPPAA